MSGTKKIWSFLVVFKLSQNGQCWKRVWSNRALSDSSDCDISQSEIVSTGPNSDCHCLRDLNVCLDAFPSSGFSVLVVIIIDVWSSLPSYHHCVTINMHLIILTIHGVIVTSWFHHHPLTALALSAITLLVARTASSLLLYSDSASSLSVSFCNHDDYNHDDDYRGIDDKTCGDCEVNSWNWS